MVWGILKADSRLTVLEPGCLRSVCHPKISLHFLPSIHWIKNYILFLLAQCMNSVVKEDIGQPSKPEEFSL